MGRVSRVPYIQNTFNLLSLGGDTAAGGPAAELAPRSGAEHCRVRRQSVGKG